MAKTLTKRFNTQMAELFKDQFSLTTESYYVFIAGHEPFDDDLSPPAPNTSVNDGVFRIKERMIYGKKITPDDVAMLATKYVWTANTEYQKYDDSLSDLHLYNFYVVADEATDQHVFKCLNNPGTPSISKPLLSETSAEDISYIKLADDYQWKYLYTISASDYNKFATEKFMPVYLNEDVRAAAVDGAIEAIALDFAGANYNSYTSGVFQDFFVGGNTQIFALESSASSNANFYNGCGVYIASGTGAGQFRNILQYTVVGDQKRIVVDEPFDVTLDNTSEYEITPYVSITGDGSGAKARAQINTAANSIGRIEMIARGTGYTYATAVVTGNTGFINVTSNTTQVANSAIIRPIISPPGGHGANNYAGLYATNLGISVSFTETESNTLPTTNDYRTVGIIRNPLYANVEVSISSPVGTFLDEMAVVQDTTGAKGIVTFANSSLVRLTNVQGELAVGNRLVSDAVSANVSAVAGQPEFFDATTTFTIELTNSGSFANGFALDEPIVQGETASGKVFFANSTVVKATSVMGVFNASGGEDAFIEGSTTGAIGKVLSITQPNVVKHSGQVLYVENMMPIQRANTQTETVKIVLKF